MSNSFPPAGPPGPEYLEQGTGAPVPRRTEPRRRGGRRKAVIGGAVVAGLLAVGGGIWAATWYFSTGAQPAEALPDSTLGYVSIDLDPSGAQKIEALKTLNKFPAFKEQFGLDAQDDIRQRVFEELQKGTGCADLDYGTDVEPWLGNRAAVAAVDTGAEQPAPVVVLQVTDADKADAGLSKLQDCMTGPGAATTGGWAIDGDWAVIAESDDVAQGVVDDAAKAPLSEDADYQSWTGKVGDPGVVNLYAAPAAGDFLSENLGDLGLLGGSDYAVSCHAAATAGSSKGGCTQRYSSQPPAMAGGASEATEALKEFKGLAATFRFTDGAVELEMAGDPGVSRDGLYGTDRGADVVATLPEDTAAAVGIGFQDGWFTQMVERMASYSGSESADELMREIGQDTGLDVPADAETLAGSSFALSIGADFDLERFFSSADASGLPIAAKVQGDPGAIETVLDKFRGNVPTEEGQLLGSDSEGDMIAIGPDAEYRSRVLQRGSLGDTAVFADVLPEADKSTAVVFVNFDAMKGWLTEAVGNDRETADNLEPLQALGISAWQDDDAAHAVVRLTTD